MKPMLKRTNNSNNRTGKFTRTHRHPAKSGAAQRNNLQQNFEKYVTLAREATSTGDRVLAESYYQFAEHYLRTLNDMKPIEIDVPIEENISKDIDDTVCNPSSSTEAMSHQEQQPAEQIQDLPNTSAN
ncbi:MAG: DUF4167 domain-containing protein [Alphaproteobacteria bacterium]|nr:DUF4167 domain-containing protein [Alphaproteobacteria bacterium]